MIKPLTLLFSLVMAIPSLPAAAEVSLLNVSYDVTRELYNEYNPSFVNYWRGKTGQQVVINQSHGGSSKQSRAVIDGLEADVVTMNQQTDIDALVDKGGLVDKNWRSHFPNNSAPYRSTIVFLVRKGNPKRIKDWDDLIRDNVSPVIPNPKTSGNGRYSYLGAWAYATRKFGTDDKAREFVGKVFKRVPVLDTGGRGATTTFVERGIGDVLLTFENEVYLIATRLNPRDFDVVIPSLSVVAEAPVAVVDKIVDRKGTRALAEAYLEYLWSEEAQRLFAKHFLRPVSEKVLQENHSQFAPLELLTVDEIAGGWANAQKKHFADGGVFDQTYGQ